MIGWMDTSLFTNYVTRTKSSDTYRAIQIKSWLDNRVKNQSVRCMALLVILCVAQNDLLIKKNDIPIQDMHS
jgi:hypothetical protein